MQANKWCAENLVIIKHSRTEVKDKNCSEFFPSLLNKYLNDNFLYRKHCKRQQKDLRNP
jgi:hypothetical protein